jgi:hypothetical protein
VLFIFSIAGTISLMRFGDVDIPKLLTVGVVVFGFAIALSGFESIAKSKTKFYHWLGVVLVTLTTSSIIILFVWFLILLANGELEAVLKGQQTKPPVATKVSTTVDSIVIDLEPLEKSTDTIEVKVSTGNVEFSPKDGSLQVEGNRITLSDLKMATVYTVRLVTKSRFGSRSKAVPVTSATRAVSLRLPKVGPDGEFMWGALYSGPVSLDGSITSTESSKIEFQRGRETWVYEGPVKDGKPDGTGKLLLVKQEPNAKCEDAREPRVCEAKCETAQFKNGLLVSGECELAFSHSEGYMNADGPIPNTGSYVGAIAEISGVAGTFELGPRLTVALQGNGIAVRNDGEVQEGTFKHGRLRYGAFFNREYEPRGIESSKVREFERTGPGILLLRDSFQFGPAGGSNKPTQGYQGRWTNGESGGYFELAKVDAAGQPTATGQLKPVAQDVFDCRNSENFGVADSFNEVEKKNGWGIHAFDGSKAYLRYIELRLERTGVAIQIYRNAGKLPVVHILLSSLETPGRESVIQVDDEKFSLERYAPQSRAPLVFAKLCGAKKITNHVSGTSEEVDGICSVLAVMMARTYYCDGRMKV